MDSRPRRPDSLEISLLAWATAWLALALPAIAAERLAPQTTLANPAARYKRSDKPLAVLRRGPVEALVITNAAGGDALPQHRAGYSGIASLKHRRRDANLFVPAYAGLNFEHIHDGKTRDRKQLFEPRNAPMELRLIDPDTVELYQAPTPNWQLESCLRYQILEDGALEMTLECIPRKRTFANGYIGLFWASYIHQPTSLDIHFRGSEPGKPERWIRGVTPAHGVNATHPAADDQRRFVHDRDFPLTLVFNRSKYVYRQPWYYGVSHGMALALMFRPRDQIRFAQSPSGGGRGNPAWDFQHFIDNYRVGQRYQMRMRALYTPFESAEQMERITRAHRKALAKP